MYSCKGEKVFRLVPKTIWATIKKDRTLVLDVKIFGGSSFRLCIPFSEELNQLARELLKK